MNDVLKRVRGWFPVLGAVGILAVGLLPGLGRAAEYEVRMPVEKTARIAPPGDISGEQRPDGPKSLPTPAAKAPKTALGRAAEAAAAVPAPVPFDAPATPKGSKPVPAKKAAKPVDEAAAKSVPASTSASTPAPQPAPRKEPKPAPPVKLDPLAQVMPPAPAEKRAPVSLPADGQWAGDVAVEFREDSVVLRVPTSGQVERVTWFNVAEPRKLALDLRGPWRRKGGYTAHFDTGPVKAVAMGEHPDRLRLAVEFRDGAVKPELDPRIETGPQGVTLTIPLAVRLSR